MAKSAATMCKKVNKEIKSQAMTLARAVLAMQEKIDAQIPVYEKLPLAQMLTTTQGEKALKNNPAMQEFRATVRDYAAALKDLNALIEEHPAEQALAASPLELLRDRFKMAE
jgi:hypothetical protein